MLGAGLALALLGSPGCERFDDTPREVAAAFWSAIEARDLEAAVAVSDAGQPGELRVALGGSDANQIEA